MKQLAETYAEYETHEQQFAFQAEGEQNSFGNDRVNSSLQWHKGELFILKFPVLLYFTQKIKALWPRPWKMLNFSKITNTGKYLKL